MDAATGRTNLYEAWHHLAGHNIFAAALLAVLAAGFTRSAVVGIGAFGCFHVHLAADLVSGRGPDGSAWPVLYLWPLSDLEWQWSGQWRLDAWPNTALFLALVAWTIVAAHRTGHSPVELACPERIDRRVIDAFRSVFTSRKSRSASPKPGCGNP